MPLLGALARAVAPTVVRESMEFGARSAVGNMAGRGVSRFVAGETGQRMIGRVAGQRVARAAASPSGQRIIKTGVKHETKQAIKQAQNPAATTQPTQPVQQMSNDPYANLTRNSRGELVRNTRGYNPMKPWWQMTGSEGMSGQQPDWRQIGDLSVDRGIGQWDLPGRKTASRMVGFAEGVRDQNRAQKAMFGQQPNVPTAGLLPGPTMPKGGMGPSAMYTPTSTSPSGPSGPSGPSRHHWLHNVGGGIKPDEVIPAGEFAGRKGLSYQGSSSRNGAFNMTRDLSPEEHETYANDDWYKKLYGGNSGEVGTGPAALGPAPRPKPVPRGRGPGY